MLCQYACVSDEAATAAVRTDAWMWRPPGFECSSHVIWGQISHLCVQKCIYKIRILLYLVLDVQKRSELHVEEHKNYCPDPSKVCYLSAWFSTTPLGDGFPGIGQVQSQDPSIESSVCTASGEPDFQEPVYSHDKW